MERNVLRPDLAASACIIAIHIKHNRLKLCACVGRDTRSAFWVILGMTARLQLSSKLLETSQSANPKNVGAYLTKNTCIPAIYKKR